MKKKVPTESKLTDEKRLSAEEITLFTYFKSLT